jgi:hypothetical protein
MDLIDAQREYLSAPEEASDAGPTSLTPLQAAM